MAVAFQLTMEHLDYTTTDEKNLQAGTNFSVIVFP